MIYLDIDAFQAGVIAGICLVSVVAYKLLGIGGIFLKRKWNGTPEIPDIPETSVEIETRKDKECLDDIKKVVYNIRNSNKLSTQKNELVLDNLLDEQKKSNVFLQEMRDTLLIMKDRTDK